MAGDTEDERLKRHDLTDAERARLEPLLPDGRVRPGRPWGDHRRVINGAFSRVRAG
ncbi:MAG TPA: hypothetical protein VI248_30245 [Kineosporiaceae bacterium]